MTQIGVQYDSCLRLLTPGYHIGGANRMDPKLENLDVNSSADEIAEYIDRFNFWIDTKETSVDKAIKGAFLTAVGKEAFTLLKTLVYPKT